jgi:hypothetical protein
MRRSSLLWISLLLLLVFPCLAHADNLINPGFETGDLTGWTAGGGSYGAFVVQSYTDSLMTYNPVFGSYFLELACWTDGYVYQDVNLTAGQVLSGAAALDNTVGIQGGIYPALQVQVFDEGTDTQIATPLAISTDNPTYGAAGPWTSWSWTAPYSGTFELKYDVNANPVWGHEYGLFDAPQPTPEPGTCALLLLGLPGLAALRRRRK